MDFQNRVGHKTGSGPPPSQSEIELDRRERLKRLALETIDLSKDPYLLANHLGQKECRLCLTVHSNEASYLSHTQGKKHQTNLSRRAAKERMETAIMPQPRRIEPKRGGIKIGRPGYRITKLRDPQTGQKALLIQVAYPEIEGKPRHRIMSAYEQRIEMPPDPAYQFVIFAATPYETIAFKVPNMEIDRGPGKYQSDWDQNSKTYSVQLHFRARTEKVLPALPQRPTTFLPIGARW